MGYNTKYELDFEGIGIPSIENKVLECLQKIDPDYFYIEPDFAHYVEKQGINFFFEEEMKWYNHDEIMCKLSAEFPDILFSLYGEGEESSDMWINYFKGGKMQHCPARITFDEFDETKLR